MRFGCFALPLRHFVISFLVGIHFSVFNSVISSRLLFFRHQSCCSRCVSQNFDVARARATRFHLQCVVVWRIFARLTIQHFHSSPSSSLISTCRKAFAVHLEMLLHLIFKRPDKSSLCWLRQRNVVSVRIFFLVESQSNGKHRNDSRMPIFFFCVAQLQLRARIVSVFDLTIKNIFENDINACMWRFNFWFAYFRWEHDRTFVADGAFLLAYVESLMKWVSAVVVGSIQENRVPKLDGKLKRRNMGRKKREETKSFHDFHLMNPDLSFLFIYSDVLFAFSFFSCSTEFPKLELCGTVWNCALSISHFSACRLNRRLSHTRAFTESSTKMFSA